MSHVLELTDEQYETFSRAAAARGQTPAEMFAAWIEELRDPLTQPRYYETDDWMRHLGVSEERIRRINAQAEAEEAEGAGAVNADADAR
jgi:hypothetical protein